MAKLTIAEKIERKKAELTAAKKRLEAIQAKINRLTKELAELENFEIISLKKELNIPTSEIRSILIELMKKAESPSETRSFLLEELTTKKTTEYEN